MKEYNCPDCKLQITTCIGCPRVPIQNNYYNNDKQNYLDTYTDPCKTCSNHPSNGGSGICSCILALPEIY